MDDQRLRELLKKAKDSDLGWKALQAKEVIECLVGLEWYLAAAGPVGGAGELLAAKAPQGVPASKPVLLDYADYAKRASGLAEQFEKMFTTMSPPPRDEVRRQLYDLFVEIDRGIWESVAGRLTASPVHIEPNPSTCTCIIGYRTSPSPITAVGQCIVHGNDAVPAPVSDDTIHPVHVGWIAGHCSDPQNCPACKADALNPSRCRHEHLNEEGICRSCGADCRGIH